MDYSQFDRRQLRLLGKALEGWLEDCREGFAEIQADNAYSPSGSNRLLMDRIRFHAWVLERNQQEILDLLKEDWRE